ncbi:uncharacterized protein MONBRDRAFT_24861 [Monosiga brevicollis MX1]|uniref:AAA+ ATPase domain-containing protein n=1 Tax=Monosiga brevicollis TaxID=81824 RepID=A9UXY9_MONBE|nr:uncharacterized protein MONBRDRAFT_24861 [Monosiga brevicollis MX1]EDQ89928.1 predicted protein [Monosiga brevicollis MX1]|eukprot:XP_001745350.1 hypothetical protein [Monosiga brevicollis MX1]
MAAAAVEGERWQSPLARLLQALPLGQGLLVVANVAGGKTTAVRALLRSRPDLPATLWLDLKEQHRTADNLLLTIEEALKTADDPPRTLVLDDLDYTVSTVEEQARLAALLLRLPPGWICLATATRPARIAKPLLEVPCLQRCIQAPPLTFVDRASFFQAALHNISIAQQLAQHSPGFNLLDLTRLLGTYHLAATLHPEAAKMPEASPGQAGVDLVALASSKLRSITVGSAKLIHHRRPWQTIRGYDALHQRCSEVARMLATQAETPPSGLLLSGPSGSGKTALAECLATASGLPCLSVNAVELLSPYLGETEGNIRRCFAAAAAAQPCILFLDNVDVVGHSRGGATSEATSGVEARALSQMLNEMDGIEGRSQVFYLGTTRQAPADLDSALLRPGRFEVCEVITRPGPDDVQSIIRATLGPTITLAEAVLPELLRVLQSAPDLTAGHVAACCWELQQELHRHSSQAEKEQANKTTPAHEITLPVLSPVLQRWQRFHSPLAQADFFPRD